MNGRAWLLSFSSHLLLLNEGGDEAPLVCWAIRHRVDHDLVGEEVNGRLGRDRPVWQLLCPSPSWGKHRGCAMTHLVGVEVDIPKLPLLEPVHQVHLLVCQLDVRTCHLVLDRSPVGAGPGRVRTSKPTHCKTLRSPASTLQPRALKVEVFQSPVCKHGHTCFLPHKVLPLPAHQ